jgi:RNA polymerase subunit RPABC4/transcription elongation factor Spt4
MMQTSSPQVDALPGTNLEYNLICKVMVQKRSYTEISDGKQHEATMVLLLPRLETTEVSRFLTTYLPEVGTMCLSCHTDGLRADQLKCPECGSEKIKTEWTEVPAWIAHPVHSPSRLALLRKNNYCSQHHLFVMGTGAEQDLMDFDGLEIHVKIFSSLADHEVDQAKSVDKTVKK